MKKSWVFILISILIFSYSICFASLNQDLLKAASKGDVSKARLLISQGADVDAVDKAGITPLMEAASGGRPDMPELWNFNGFATPTYHFSMFKNLVPHIPHSEMSMARFLIDKGADVNLKNDYGRTALMLAAKYGQADMVELLLENGANVNAKDNNGRAALDYAYQSEHQQIASLIKEYRRHLNSQSVHPVDEQLSQKWNLTQKEAAQIAARAIRQAEGPTQKKIARQLQSLAQEIASLKKREAFAKKSKPILSDVDHPSFHMSSRPDDFALVVGVEKYAQNLPDAEFAERDARVVKKYLIAMGILPRHIRSLFGPRATKSDLAAYLEDWLPRNMSSKSRVFFYFSGHGAPDPATGNAYLVPFDGNPEFLAKTAYPLSRVYADLRTLKAQHVIVILDSCFSGVGARSVIEKGARPLMTKIKEGGLSPGGNIAVLAASKKTQIANVIKKQGHGLFTYYFLKGLNGKAINRDGHVTLGSLYQYLEPAVEDAADLDNESQDPQLLPVAAHDIIAQIIMR